LGPQVKLLPNDRELPSSEQNAINKSLLFMFSSPHNAARSCGFLGTRAACLSAGPSSPREEEPGQVGIIRISNSIAITTTKKRGDSPCWSLVFQGNAGDNH